MRKLVALAIAVALLLPGAAFASSSTDAALGLGAFAVFNQILGGVGVFHRGPVPVVVAPAPPPVVVVPPPPPVVYQPAPVYYQPAPVYYPPPPVYYRPQPVFYRPAPPPVVVIERPHKHWQRTHWGRGYR